MEIKFIISETEIDSFEAWKAYLNTPTNERKETGDLVTLCHKIQETLDGYGVELKDVIPIKIQRKKDKVSMQFKFVDSLGGKYAEE